MLMLMLTDANDMLNASEKQTKSKSEVSIQWPLNQSRHHLQGVLSSLTSSWSRSFVSQSLVSGLDHWFGVSLTGFWSFFCLSDHFLQKKYTDVNTVHEK